MVEINKEKTSPLMRKDQIYRELPYLNYTAIKKFDESRTKFHREFILKLPVKEKRSDVLVFGSLVDCLLFSPVDYDKRFCPLAVGEIPTGQIKDFTDALWEITKEAMDGEDGKINRPIEAMIEEAFNQVAFDKKGQRVAFKGKTLEWVVEAFQKDAEVYYKKLRSEYGKDVIDAGTYSAAESIVRELYLNQVTRHVLSPLKHPTSTRFAYPQLQILFEVNGVKLKALLDMCVIDTEEKKIYIYDLKVTARFEVNVVKERYYLQAGVYYLAIKVWAKENGYEDFEIVPMQFIVASPDISESPLIYVTDEKDLNYSLNGFTTIFGNKRKGVHQILEDIGWHQSEGIWHISREDYLNNGVRKFSLFEEE